MGVKVRGKGYKKARKHRKGCPCTRCQFARDVQQQVSQLDSIGVSKFMIRENWGDE